MENVVRTGTLLCWLGLMLGVGSAPAGAAPPVLVGPEPARTLAHESLLAAPRSVAPARTVYERLREEGWLWASLRRSATGDTLQLRPGPRAKLGRLRVLGADSLSGARFLAGAGLAEGRPYRPARWALQARAGLRVLAERGRAFASVAVRGQEGHPETGTVDLELWLAPGPRVRVGELRVEGAEHTRPEVLARLAGVDAGTPYRESMLEELRQRLAAREVVESVEAVEPEPMAGAPDRVRLRVRVRQPRTLGRVAAAVGVVREQGGDSRVSGSVDLTLLDLFGSARQLHGRWLDDGVARRRLDVAFLEPLLFHSPLDLRISLGQRHEDDLYDTVLGDLDLRLPWRGDHRLELGLGADRTTFVGEESRVRTRRRAHAAVGLRRRRPLDRGFFGAFDTRLEGAWVHQTVRAELGAEASSKSLQQTLVEAEGSWSWARSSTLALMSRAVWRSVSADELPLPASELWYVGGATSLRGYREEQFRGERVAYGGLELILGPERRGQAYGFFDLGWIFETRETNEGIVEREQWPKGFGLGLRSPTRLGAIDLSIGFGGEFSFDAGKLHLALVQTF